MSLEDNDNIGLQQGQETAQKLDDFNAELSGTKAGYIYVTSAASSKIKSDIHAEKARKADVQLSALQALLNDDPAYATAYTEAENTITDFEERMKNLLREIDETVDRIDERLEALGPHATGSAEQKRLFHEREALHRRQQDLLDYHHKTIQPMKDRMADQDNPPSKAELDKFNDQVQRDMEDTFSIDHEEQVTPDPIFTKTAELKLPDLGAKS